MELIESECDLGQSSLDIIHWQGCEQAKASRMLFDDRRPIFVDHARLLEGRMNRQREHLGSYVVSIHEIERILRRPCRHRGGYKILTRRGGARGARRHEVCVDV